MLLKRTMANVTRALRFVNDDDDDSDKDAAVTDDAAAIVRRMITNIVLLTTVAPPSFMFASCLTYRWGQTSASECCLQGSCLGPQK